MVNAFKASRKAIESTYIGICSVVEQKDVTDGKTKLTRQEQITVIENQPCKLSFESLKAVVQTDTVANLSQGAKLLIAPEIKIKGGSKIIVTQNGTTTEYSCSGEPAIYFSHQEIMLELFKGWA